jgi:hypothetical protein
MTASATEPGLAPPPVAKQPSSNGSAGRPELLIAATFAGGFVIAKILKRLARQ